MSLTQYLGCLRSFSFSIASGDLSCGLLPLPGCQCRSRRCTPRCWQAASSCTRRTRPGSPVEGGLGFTRTKKHFEKGTQELSNTFPTLYSWPHFSLTMTALPVSPLRKGLGFMGMEAILNLTWLSEIDYVSVHKFHRFILSVMYYHSLLHPKLRNIVLISLLIMYASFTI